MEKIINQIKNFIADGNIFYSIILVLVILIITYIVKRLTSKYIFQYFERTSTPVKFDPTHFALLKHASSAIIYLTGLGFAVYVVPPLRSIAVSLFAGAGIMAVVIGFASQKAVSNLIGGIFIAIFKPFRVGDIIKFNDRMGTVEDINLRHTVIRNYENKRFIVPNSTISEEVIENFNISDEKICHHFEIGISYDSNIDKAIDIIRREAMKHPSLIDIRTPQEIEKGEPQVAVRVVGFGDSSVNLKAWAWSKDPIAAFRMGCDLNKSIKEGFDREGIEIPFPYRTVVFKKDLEDSD